MCILMFDIQEFIVETSETVVTEGVEVETEPLETEETFEPPQPVLQQQPQPQQQVHEDVGVGEFTAIVYQDTEQFYTETIVTDSGMALPVEVETTEIRQVRRTIIIIIMCWENFGYKLLISRFP